MDKNSRSICDNNTDIRHRKKTSTEEEDNIFREEVTDQHHTTIINKEDYINAYSQDRWLGPIWAAAQKPQEDLKAKEKLAMKYYSVMEDGLLYLAKADDPGMKRLRVPASQNNTLRKLVLYQAKDTTQDCIKVEIKRLTVLQTIIIGQPCTMMYEDTSQFVNLVGRMVQT